MLLLDSISVRSTVSTMRCSYVKLITWNRTPFNISDLCPVAPTLGKLMACYKIHHFLMLTYTRITLIGSKAELVCVISKQAFKLTYVGATGT